VNVVKTVEKMLLVYDGELDVEQLQATYLTVGRVIEARQVCAMHSLCFSYQTAALLLSYNIPWYNVLFLLIAFQSHTAFSDLTLLVGRQEGHLACKTEW